jgi:hypothetical protein
LTVIVSCVLKLLIASLLKLLPPFLVFPKGFKPTGLGAFEACLEAPRIGSGGLSRVLKHALRLWISLSPEMLTRVVFPNTLSSF